MSSSDNTQVHGQTNMTHPPKAQTKMVKIKAIHPIRVGTREEETIVSPGQQVDVTEDQAKEFCDKKFDIGYKDTFGNRHPSEAQKKYVTRAERVK